MRRRFSRLPLEFPLLLLLMALYYILLHDAMGGTLLRHEPLDSYTLQSLAWLRGENFLRDGRDLPWLELAIYGGKYYVSFPPVPSVVMLPFVLFFGAETPNNLLVALYGLLALTGAYRACRAVGMGASRACFWSLFAVYASNLLEISTNGGVWLQAQCLNLALLFWGVDCALRGRRTACLALLALAVGCRPFSLLYLPVALLYFYRLDRAARPQEGRGRTCLCLAPPIAVAAVIGGAYMCYNLARFDNPFEFGHNYLPEFMRAEHGQFHIGYLWQNLYNILLRPVTFGAGATISYPKFDGFMFYVANPFFIVFAVRAAQSIRRRRMDPVMAACCAGLVLGLLALCLHKTFGGWQFGARYTLDLLPFAFFFLLLNGRFGVHRWERFLCAFGLLFNVYGTVIMRIASQQLNPL